MNMHSSLRNHRSLLERAADVYDFALPTAPAAAMPAAAAAVPATASEPAPPADEAERADPVLDLVSADDDSLSPQPVPEPQMLEVGTAVVDRKKLAAEGFLQPDAPVGGLAEELRIVKRQLLQNRAALPAGKRQSILICSAQPDEGKSFCAINLAFSLASEKDLGVLLVDGDFSKPELLSTLGLEGGPGLTDALADADADVRRFVIDTDIPGLSVLPAGRQANNVTELLGSERTEQVLADLAAAYPTRIILFDSPPALVASPAAVLAGHVGQVVMVVRADATTEADLREALTLLSGCAKLSLLLNAAAPAITGRRFGSYYGYGQ